MEERCIRTLFVVNPVAGRNACAARWRRFEEGLRRSADFPFEVHITARPSDAERVIREAANAGIRRVVVAGGDGTVNEAVNGVLSCAPEWGGSLGILPFGTGNDLARSLSIPRRDKDLLSMLCRPTETGVNVGRVNGRAFVLAAGIGFDARVADDVNRHTGLKQTGKIGYALSAMRMLQSFQPTALRIEVDGEPIITGDLWLLAAGNCPYYAGGMKMFPNAVYDDDLLDVCIVSNLDRLHFLQLFPFVYAGKHVGWEKYVRMVRGREIRIESDQNVMAHADGEVFPTTSLQIQMVGAQIRVITPEAASMVRANSPIWSMTR